MFLRGPTEHRSKGIDYPALKSKNILYSEQINLSSGKEGQDLSVLVSDHLSLYLQPSSHSLKRVTLPKFCQPNGMPTSVPIDAALLKHKLYTIKATT